MNEEYKYPQLDSLEMNQHDQELNQTNIVLKSDREYYSLVYTNSLTDCFAFYKYNWFHNKVFLSLVLLNAILVNFKWLMAGNLIYALFGIFVTFILYFAAIIAISIPINLLIVYSKRDTTLTEHILMFFEDHFIERTACDNNKHYWKDIKRVVQDNNYIFLYLTNSKSHIIPKKIFSSEAEINSFITFIQTRINMEKALNS